MSVYMIVVMGGIGFGVLMGAIDLLRRRGRMGLHVKLVLTANAVLLTLATGLDWNAARIVVQSLETGERRVLVVTDAALVAIWSGRPRIEPDASTTSARFSGAGGGAAERGASGARTCTRRCRREGSVPATRGRSKVAWTSVSVMARLLLPGIVARPRNSSLTQ